ncbi:hypothetical protein LIA77_09863 [Sarocladium implicatum]|nr:hypothetical protein LIA77_09863 [Sarocladium implicatum]
MCTQAGGTVDYRPNWDVPLSNGPLSFPIGAWRSKATAKGSGSCAKDASWQNTQDRQLNPASMVILQFGYMELESRVFIATLQRFFKIENIFVRRSITFRWSMCSLSSAQASGKSAFMLQVHQVTAGLACHKVRGSTSGLQAGEK